jgi:hypothetical protein
MDSPLCYQATPHHMPPHPCGPAAATTTRCRPTRSARGGGVALLAVPASKLPINAEVAG